MEEFDINFDNLDDNLNKMEMENQNHQKNSDKILPKNECFNCEEKPKKTLNMDIFARNLETKLDKMQPRWDVLKEPFNVENIDSIKIANNIAQNTSKKYKSNKKEEIEESSYFQNPLLLTIIFFVLLNLKQTIEFIYDNVSFTRDLNNPYYNLLLRTIIFSLIMFYILKTTKRNGSS